MFSYDTKKKTPHIPMHISMNKKNHYSRIKLLCLQRVTTGSDKR